MKTPDIRIASALFALGALLAGSVLADGRDSLVHWWKATDLNGDGLLQANELIDLMSVGSGQLVTAETVVQNTDDAAAKPIAIEKGVYVPSLRRTFADEQTFTINNPTNWVDGKLVANNQAITLPKSTSLGGNTGSVVMRFKFSGLKCKDKGTSGNYSKESVLFANNRYYDPNWGWKGWAILTSVYSSTDPSTRNIAFRTGGSGTSTYEDQSWYYLCRTGKWYDLGVSFSRDANKKTTVHFVLRQEKRDTGGTAERTHRSLTKTFTDTSGYNTMPAAGTYPSYIGISGSTSFNAVTAGEPSAPATFSEVRVYSQALTPDELLREIATMPELTDIGAANGSGNEFTDSAETAAVYEPDTMPWSRMRKTLNADHPSASVCWNLDANGYALGRFVTIRLLKGSGCRAERVTAALNGACFGSKAIPTDGVLRFYLSEQRLSKLAKNADGKYPATVTFSRTGDMTGDLVIDSVSLSSDVWQLGARDNSCAEFGGNGDDYYNFYYNVGQNYLKHLVWGLGDKGSYAYMYLLFPVDAWATNLTHRLTVKSVGSNALSYTFKVNPDMSGADPVFTQNFAVGELKNDATIELPPGTLHAGDNFLYVSEPGASSVWDNFDYWKLETVKPKDFRNTDEGEVRFSRWQNAECRFCTCVANRSGY